MSGSSTSRSEGDRLRDEGCAKALATEDKQSEWRRRYQEAAALFFDELQPGQQFSMDEMHDQYRAGIGEAHCGQCWGAAAKNVVGGWMRQGLVREVQCVVRSAVKTNHSTRTRVYEKLATIVPPSRLAGLMANAMRETVGEYLTTADSCSCPDHVYRHRVCKHMLAVRAAQGQNVELPKQPATKHTTTAQTNPLPQTEEQQIPCHPSPDEPPW